MKFFNIYGSVSLGTYFIFRLISLIDRLKSSISYYVANLRITSDDKSSIIKPKI